MGTIISKEQFETQTDWKCSYEEYKLFYCPDCDKKDCIHREAYRRVPVVDGGLGLCPNLKEGKKMMIKINANVLIDELINVYTEV